MLVKLIKTVNMDILVLGTSATKPFPRKDCCCPICSSKDKKDRRRRSSILINHQFLIDCGPDILTQVKRFKLRVNEIKAIFITHAHQDHTAGLKEMPLSAIPLYLSPNSQKQLAKKSLSRFQIKIIKHGHKIKIGNLIFQPLTVIHPGSKSTFAFKIRTGRKNLIYLPDYKRIPKKSLKYFKNIDILIIGGSSLERRLPWHATIKESIKLVKKLRIKKIFFTHIGHRTLPHEELIRFVKKVGGENFNVCFDGQRLRV